MSDIAKKAPHFQKLVEQIKTKSVFQKKIVERLLNNADERYLKFAESVVSRLIKVVDRGEAYDYLSDTYLWYTKLLRIEEMYYAKEGKYRYDNYEEVYEKVYGRDDYMFDYVVGLGLTQPLWPNHYRIFRFFLDEFVPLIEKSQHGAEVGVGHGLFHAEAMKGAPSMHTTLLDVSNTSLNFTMKMIDASGMDNNRSKPVNVDVQREIPIEDGSLDMLLMGELIEHIEEGDKVMSDFARKMTPFGLCYFSTAANAPAEDHILLFRNTGQIRDFINANGWSILKEKYFTINDMFLEKAEAEGHSINYVAVLSARR